MNIINKYGGNMPGAIGVPEEQLRKAAGMAVCKINIDSDIRLAITATDPAVLWQSIPTTLTPAST